MWEEFDLEQMFDYTIENVFENIQDKESSRGIKFGKYIEALFENLNNKMSSAEFQPGQKECLDISDFVTMGMTIGNDI